MKNQKQTVKKLTKDLIYAFFMSAPHPMAITRVEDGTYIEINEAAAKFMRSSREELIGCKSTETGHMPLETRQKIIEEIKAKGFAKSIELEARITKIEVLYLLFNVFPMKRGKNSFFLSVVTDISKSKHKNNDVIFRLRLSDTDRIKEKLKQMKFSPRQHEAALLASCGYSNSEIAKKMYISEYTVKDHLKEVYKEIGVKNRSQLNSKILNLL